MSASSTLSRSDHGPAGASGLLEEVRRACADVARRAQKVILLEDRLPGYASRLLREEGGGLEMDPAVHHLGRGEETVAFFVALDAVNFGSGYFPEIFPDPSRSGYRRIAAALTERFRKCGPMPAAVLADVGAEDCARLFGLDLASPLSRELAGLFARAWNDLGRFLSDHFGGEFIALVDAAEGSAERLAALLSAMPLYRDVADYRGLRVPFYKRAQITAVDLHIAFGGEGPGRFSDVDSLTLLADNLVPHVLRSDGVLRYDSELADRIDRGEPLRGGSLEEIELRAAAVHGAELLVAELGRQGRHVNALWVDNRLWHRGQRPEYRSRPRHRTLTPFY